MSRLRPLYVSHSVDFSHPLQLSTEVPAHNEEDDGPY